MRVNISDTCGGAGPAPGSITCFPPPHCRGGELRVRGHTPASKPQLSLAKSSTHRCQSTVWLGTGDGARSQPQDPATSPISRPHRQLGQESTEPLASPCPPRPCICCAPPTSLREQEGSGDLAMALWGTQGHCQRCLTALPWAGMVSAHSRSQVSPSVQHPPSALPGHLGLLSLGRTMGSQHTSPEEPGLVGPPLPQPGWGCSCTTL